MQTSEFIDQLAAGNVSSAKDMLNDLLSSRAFEALETRKVQLAQNIFNGGQSEETTEEATTEEQ